MKGSNNNSRIKYLPIFAPLRLKDVKNNLIPIYVDGGDYYMVYSTFALAMCATLTAMQKAQSATNIEPVILNGVSSHRKYLRLSDTKVLAKYLIENPCHFAIREQYEKEEWSSDFICAQLDISKLLDEEPVSEVPQKKRSRESNESVVVVESDQRHKKEQPPPRIDAEPARDKILWQDLFENFRQAVNDATDVMNGTALLRAREEAKKIAISDERRNAEERIKYAEERIKYADAQMKMANEKIKEYHELVKSNQQKF